MLRAENIYIQFKKILSGTIAGEYFWLFAHNSFSYHVNRNDEKCHKRTYQPCGGGERLYAQNTSSERNKYKL